VLNASVKEMSEQNEILSDDVIEEPTVGEDRDGGGEFALTPGDQLRALPAEAESHGTRFVSAQAMQARLFSVYDAAAAAEEALALVQQQLTLTLQRRYYEAEEIEQMADELDALLIQGELDDQSVGAET
jgi:hypothetical protein